MKVSILKPYMQTGDDRGAFLGLMNSGNWKEANLVETKKDQVRGNHYHKQTEEVIFMLSGKAKVHLTNVNNPSEQREIILGKMEGIHIHPYMLHELHYLEDSVHIAFLDCSFDPQKPDLHQFKKHNYETI